jgi:hypothetical protein
VTEAQKEENMTRALRLALSTVFVLSACSSQTVNPVTATPVVGYRLTQGSKDAHGQLLTAVSGTGTGIVNVTATAQPVAGTPDGFGFSVEGEVNVHGAPPNTTFLVQRKPDLNVNGICEGPAFITVPFPRPGPLVTLTTSEDGAGAAHFSVQFPTELNGSPFPDGTTFDVMFRLLESSPSPGATELRTECFTVTTK